MRLRMRLDRRGGGGRMWAYDSGVERRHLKLAGLQFIIVPLMRGKTPTTWDKIYYCLWLLAGIKTVSIIAPTILQFKEDPIYVFPEMKLCFHVPIFHIHVSVTDLYIPTIAPPFLHQNRRTNRGNINPLQKLECGSRERGRKVSFPGIFVSKFWTMSLQCSIPLRRNKLWKSVTSYWQIYNDRKAMMLPAEHSLKSSCSFTSCWTLTWISMSFFVPNFFVVG